MPANSNQNPPMAAGRAPLIGIDARTFDYSDSVSRGIGHYALHHMLAAGQLRPDWQFALLNDSGKSNSTLDRLLSLPNFSVHKIDSCTAKLDLFHIPDPMNLSAGFDSPTRLFGSVPATVTFHDLTPLRYYWRTWPEVNQRAYLIRLEQLRSRRVRLLANSEFTKRDLIEETQIAEARVTTVLAGLNRGADLSADPTLVPAVRNKYHISRPFFLHVGALDPHKNFETVIQAFGRLPRGSAELVVVGQMDGFLKQIADFCAKSKMKDIIFTGFIPRADLEVLYREAIALLFLSHYEGFGFPVLEAMAQRCPVIASNVTSIPEIAGDAAMLFDPTDAAGVSQAMLSLSRSLTKRETLRQKGLAQAARFTWESTAKMTISVWEQMLDPKSETAEIEATTPSAKVTPPKQTVSPAAAGAALKTPIIWLAPWQNPSGYCSEAFAFARGLEGHCKLELADAARTRSEQFVAGLPDAMRSLLSANLRTAPAVAGKIVVQHLPASGFSPLPGAKYCIGRTMFETDSLPANWVAQCNRLDEIWVPSRFNLETFAAAGVTREKLFVIPQAVDETVFNPDAGTPLELPGRAKFNFLAMFEWSSRKAWDVLLAAYLREFSAADDVCLYLRTYLVNQPDKNPQSLLEPLIRKLAATLDLGDKPLPKIEFLTEQIPTRELPRLYKAVDCLVAPSRGEGWGRPHHEAMMMGLPVIATNWSGNTEFMSDENSFLLNYELVRVENADPGFEHYRGHCWANPSEPHLRELMRQVQQNPETARAKGARAREQMLERFSLAPVASIVLRRLAEIEAGRSAARSMVKTATAPVKVDWIGSFLDAGSLSHVNRELTNRLAASNQVQLSRVNNGAETSRAFKTFANELAKVASTDAAFTVRHAWPPNWTRPKSGKLVVVQPWEFGSLPEQWVKDSANVDEFWVPTHYVRNVYVESGVPASKVFVVPNGVDTAKFNPQAEPMKLSTTKKFKFLFVGGTILRKGPDVLLKAYLNAFTAADDVCLVIKDFGGKTVYAGQTFEEKIHAAQAQPNAPQILYLNDELAPDQLPALYRACDCLVLPYRGEGYGLPVVEAMACGLPVMVTAGGATDDFVRDEFAFRIPAHRQIFGNEISGLKLVKSGWLLEPNGEVLAQHMKWLAAHPQDARERGCRAAEYAKNFCSWESAAKLALERIAHLNNARTEVRAPEAKSAKRAAITLPACALVGHLGEARELLRQKKSRLAWDAALAAIAKRPFHPEAYLFLAEIALAVGDGPDAKLCAEYARRIAPEFKAAKKFLNQRLNGNHRPDWLKLPEQVQSPKPNVQSRLSICLIVKNEERFIAQCLKSVRDVAQQIVVVDTGSTDRTVEIAKEFGAEVHSFTWCDDFSAARNAALEHATGDWVLALDADEELSAKDQDSLRKAMSDASVMAWRLPIVDIGREKDGCSYVPRLFRNGPGLFYLGRVHEQVFSSIEVRRLEWGLENKIGNATLIHHGYTQELVRDRNKIERNLKLLEKAVEELPDEPHLLMNLGLELARSGREAEAFARYREAFESMSSKPAAEIVPELRESLLSQYCTRLTAAKNVAETVRVLTSPLARMGTGLTASLHFSLGLAHLELKQFSEAADQMRQCLAKRGQRSLSPIHRDILTAAPFHCLAVSLAALGKTDDAEKAFQAGLKEIEHVNALRLDYARFLFEQKRAVDALHPLNEIVTHDPHNVAAWRLGGQIALSSTEFLEFARDWTAEATCHVPDDLIVKAQRAEVLMLSEDLAGARPLWEKCWNTTRNPQVLAALILCEAVAGAITHTPEDTKDEIAISRAFIEWYQKLFTAHAEKTLTRVNEQMNAISNALPIAAKMLTTAMAEAKEAVAA